MSWECKTIVKAHVTFFIVFSHQSDWNTNLTCARLEFTRLWWRESWRHWHKRDYVLCFLLLPYFLSNMSSFSFTIFLDCCLRNKTFISLRVHLPISLWNKPHFARHSTRLKTREGRRCLPAEVLRWTFLPKVTLAAEIFCAGRQKCLMLTVLDRR